MKHRNRVTGKSHIKRIGTSISTAILAIAAVMSAAVTPTSAIAQEVDPFDDTNLSIYAGRNININLYENEGTIICGGNLNGDIKAGIAGKVEWGMGYIPVAGADFVSVGGNMYLANNAKTVIGGNIRVGGKFSGTKPKFITLDNATGISNTPGTLTEGLGTDALNMDLDGSGQRIDFNGFTEKSVKPLAASLSSEKTTGTVEYSTIADESGHKPFKDQGLTVDIKNEGLLVFRGDGRSDKQVFELDLNEVNSKYTENGYSGWSLDFENIPEDAYIVVNVKSSSNATFHPGWRTILNGKNITTQMNSYGDDMAPFRDFASHLIWNFDNSENTSINILGNSSLYGHASSYCYVLFPGSIVSGSGSISSNIDTNGRIIAAQDITLRGSEHHNLPWKASRITNKQTDPEDAEIVLTANKICEGSEIDLSKFEFELHEGKDGTGKVLQTKNAESDGTITFDPIHVSYSDLNGAKSKDYSFSVTEVNNHLDCVDYDTHVATYDVTVSDDGTTGWLIYSTESKDTLFKNYYSTPSPLPNPVSPNTPPVIFESGNTTNSSNENTNTGNTNENTNENGNTNTSDNNNTGTETNTNSNSNTNTSTGNTNENKTNTNTGTSTSSNENEINTNTQVTNNNSNTNDGTTFVKSNEKLGSALKNLVQTGVETPIAAVVIGSIALVIFVAAIKRKK